jgi:5-methylthioadenosine/S-adenosylhomocysteine deaminase
VGRTLVRGGCIVSMDDSVGDFPQGDILIEDGVIVRVASHVDADQAELIENACAAASA